MHTDRSILTPWYALGQSRYPETNFNYYNLADKVEVQGRHYYNRHVDNRGDNHVYARKVAAESTV